MNESVRVETNRSSNSRWNWLKVFFIVGAVLTTAIGAGGYWVYLRANPVANPSHDYAADLRQLIEEPQPREGENAWPLLMTAFNKAKDAIGQSRDGMEAVTYQKPLYGPWNPKVAGPALVVVAAARAAGAFADLRRTADLVRCVPEALSTSSGLQMVYLPLSAGLRELARLITFDIRQAFVEGRPADIVEDIRMIRALARHVSSLNLLTAQLSASAVHEAALQEIVLEIGEGGYDEPTARALLEALGEGPPIVSFASSIQGERLVNLDLIQNTFTDDGHGDGRIIWERQQALTSPMNFLDPGPPAEPPTEFEKLVQTVLPSAHPSRKETVGLLDRMIDQLTARCAMSPLERAESPFDVLKETGYIGHDGAMESSILTAPIQAIDQMMSMPDWIAVTHAATRLALALDIHKCRHGSFPATLNDLDPTILATTILDPINGLPFGYRLANLEAEGLPFVIYSLGLDGVDQQGDMYVTKRDVNGKPTQFSPEQAMRDVVPFDSMLTFKRREPWWDGNRD